MSKKTAFQFVIAGKQVKCLHCGNAKFDSRRILMNTRGATLVKFDWLNRTAVSLTCQKCGRIEWFNEVPEAME